MALTPSDYTDIIHRSVLKAGRSTNPCLTGVKNEEEAVQHAAREAMADGWHVISALTTSGKDDSMMLYGVRLHVKPAYPDNQVPGCRGCGPGFHPDHYPSPGCMSGKRNHCTCDYCF